MGKARRFDTLEVICIGLLLLVGGFTAGRGYALTYHAAFLFPQDLVWLRERYGPNKWSERAEEWIVRDFFQDEKEGTFVDVGSADATAGSNTYFLEHALGWSGVAVDALSEYGVSYEERRPRTKFFALFVSDRSDDEATIYVSRRFEHYSSRDRDFTLGYVPVEPEARRIPTISLDDLLNRAGIARIDFLSIDVELSEPLVLAGFDLRRAAPRLVCIEAHAQTRQAILDYFAARGYVVQGKYLRIDTANLWFAPLTTQRAGASREPASR